MENTAENRETLAQAVFENWDHGEVAEFCLMVLEEGYEMDNELFERDWTDVIGE
jgi:hypothetical protein